MDRRRFLTVSGIAVAAATVPSYLDAADARMVKLPKHKVLATLNKRVYAAGEVMTLTINEKIGRARRISVKDSSGIRWRVHSNNKRTAVFQARATGPDGGNQVTVRVTRIRDGAIHVSNLGYGVSVPGAASSADPGDSRWAGHQPGKVLLGLASLDFPSSLSAVGAVGLHRTFYGWNDAREGKTIVEDHENGRLPWVSFKPPGGGVGGWSPIAEGGYDADIRARARRYAAYDGPVIATFHHEPGNEGGNPAQWAAAWTRQFDLMNDETGLKNVTFAPIIQDWEFNPKNRGGQPEAFLTGDVLERIPFCGIDLYQNDSGGFKERLGRVLDFMEDRGVKDPMVGVGETGCCLAESADPASWLAANWEWAAANTDKIGAISYYDSTLHSKAGHVWSLDETATKMSTYKEALAAPEACRRLKKMSV